MNKRKPKTPLRLRSAPPAEGIADGVTITRARLAAGMTQEQAARAFGLSISAYNRWEGARTLKPVNIEGALAIFAQLTPAEGITEGVAP